VLAVGCGHNARYYTDAGNTLYGQKKYEDASINYRKALQKDPAAGDAYLGLGRSLLAQKGKTGDAYAALTQAVQVAPQNFEAKEALANLALAAYISDPRHPKNLYDQLTKLAGQFTAHDARSYQGLRLRGYLALSDRHSADAIGYFRQALQAKPGDIEVSLILAQTLFPDPATVAEGEKIVLDTISRHKDAGAAYDVMINRYLATKRPEQAEGLLKAKVEANPHEAVYILQLAELYRRSGKMAEMKATLAPLLSDSKNFPKGQLQLGDYYSQIGDRDQALKYFQQGAESASGPDQLVYQKRTIGLLSNLRQFDQAMAATEAALKNHPKDSDLHLARGVVLLEMKKVDPAIQELEELAKDQKDDPVLKYELGRAKQAKGEAKEAAALWQEAAKLRPTYLEPKMALASSALQQRNYDEALRETDQILTNSPRDFRARILRSSALQGLNRPAEAEVVLTGLQKEYPENREVEIELAFLSLRERKLPDAEKMFRAQYTAGQDNLRPMTGLVESLVKQNRSDEAIRVLQADLTKAPGRAPVQFLLAEVYANAGRPESAVPVLEQIITAHPDSIQAIMALGQLQQNMGKLDVAIATFQKARAAAPKSPQPVILQAQAEGLAGKYDLAKQDYQAALQIDPSNVLALNNLAYLDADTGANLDEAMRLITSASQKMPKQPNLSDTLGYVYLKQKKYDNAVRVFETLAQQYPSNPTYLFHHGLALLESGSKTMAKKQLEAALAAKPAPALANKIKEALGRVG